MAIQRSQDDSYVKEMAKWETRDVFVNGTFVQAIPFDQGGRGGAPREEYPKMLYRGDAFDGGARVSGTKVVQDEGQERLAVGQGWCARQEEAIADVGRRHLEMGRLAAERAHTERWMSEAAQAEARAVDESTMQHVPMIPVTPIRKRGRPAKVTSQQGEGA